ncbi:MAG: hypothetical protein ABEK59_10325 [Halobacteria archaeon]
MVNVNTAFYSAHLIFAALWVGTTAFVTWGVLPLARNGDINSNSLGFFSHRYSVISIISSLVLLFSGGHLAATKYTFGSLQTTTQGHLVLSMVVLWGLMTGVVQAGASILKKGVDDGKVREPASSATNLFRIGTLIGLILLVVGVELVL